MDPNKIQNHPQPPIYPQSYPTSGQPIFSNVEPPPPYSAQPPAPGYIHVQQTGTETMGIPLPPSSTTHVITVQPVSFGLSPNPFQITCPNCHATTLTETTSVPGLLTYLAAGTLFLCGCWAGCCLIPCCIPECLDVGHRCSNCKTSIGRYRRI